MLVYSTYPGDPRVRREAEALAGAELPIDIICLRNRGEKARERIKGVEVYRLPISHRRPSQLLLLNLLVGYMLFCGLAFFLLTYLWMRKRYSFIQVHNMPDFLVFLAAVPKLFGTRVILDIHDLVPEAYASQFGVDEDSLIFRIMRVVERVSTSFANYVITAGEPFRAVLISRGLPRAKVTVIMNSADPALFHPVSESRTRSCIDDHTFQLMYHGSILESYGLDTAVEAVRLAKHVLPDLRFDIYGRGPYLAQLEELLQISEVSSCVRYGGYLPLDEIPEIIEGADAGIIAYRGGILTDLLIPTKAFEYIVMGVPVIISRTKTTQQLFDEWAVMFFEADNAQDLCRAIIELYQDPARRQRLVENAQNAYQPYCWELMKERYLRLVMKLGVGELDD